MTHKWNLQDIRPAGRKRERSRRPFDQKQDLGQKRERATPEYDSEVSAIEVTDGKKSKRKRVVVASVIGLCILGIGFGISFMVGGAEVTITPKQKEVTVQATFDAYTEPKAGELGYELLVLEADGERQVNASGEEEVSERTTGNVFIYNAYSTTPQRLIKNTRFESPEGLIFRIEESVEVPGRTTDATGAVVPGVITAKVFADGVGEQYNIAPTRFNIPGLDDTEMDEKIYAESTATFTGGFDGTKFIIEDSELETAKQALQIELRDALLGRLDTERPAGFVLYLDAITFAFDTLPATEYGEDLVTIKERARLQVPIFPASDFASFIAENTVTGYEGAPVRLLDPYTLTFNYTDEVTGTEDIAQLTKVSFNLSGDALVLWEFDEDKLLRDITGLPKTGIPNMLSGYPAIERAEAVVRPFWKQSFPDTAEKIEIITKLEGVSDMN